ncbi:MAG: 50S ribosomal protein L1 [Deltaproteobacteria bacterium]|nr:50S ribosomal protein L1 [Deltaproteobacteria bacterium]
MANRSKRWRGARGLVDPDRRYTLGEAVALVRENATARFDETIEVAVRLGVDPRQADQMIRGAVSLPHGTGRKVRVVVFAQGDAARAALDAGADAVGSDDLVQRIQTEGWLEFDKAVATPDLMPKVSRLGKILGPRGLMPNPKVGTVVPGDRIAETVREIRAGKIEFRVEKAGIIHAAVGKASMTEQQLTENITTLVQTLVRMKPTSAKGTYVRTVALASTMGPGIRIDTNDLTRTSDQV